MSIREIHSTVLRPLRRIITLTNSTGRYWSASYRICSLKVLTCFHTVKSYAICFPVVSTSRLSFFYPLTLTLCIYTTIDS